MAVTSVSSEWERLREVGATAREMLVEAAADLWKVDKATCRAQNGTVIDGTGKKATYGQLASRAAKMPIPREVPLKDASKFKIIGKPVKRLDTPEKTNGTAMFGIDVEIPGMMVALVARPPVFGAKVQSFKADKAKAIPGVQDVVRVPWGIAVTASGFWQAKKARDALEIEWSEGPDAQLSTDAIFEQYANLAKKPGSIIVRKGDAQQGMLKTVKQISAEYRLPYLAHATMEPLNCVVDLRSDSCEIWTGTESQTADRNQAARVAGLKPEQVQIHTMLLGGGFGRRANPQSDFVVMAVEVAKAVKQPVKVIWTREDDMKGGYYRPLWYDRISGGLGANGELAAWRQTSVGQSIMAGSPIEESMIEDDADETSVEEGEGIPYDIPNILVDLHSPKIGIPVQWWRSVGHSQSAFVEESFMDELAHAAGKDPFEFRLGLLTQQPRHKAVLELTAQKAGWKTRLADGRGRGIALHKSFGSFVVQVAEVSVTKEGQVKVHRVVCGIDCGRVVNPNIVEAQMESGIAFGLTAALYGAITLKNGRVQQSNFNNYPLLTLSEMPKVEVHIVPSQEPPSGVGEPGVPPIAPAVANAIFAATGKRIRSLPLSAGELKKG